VQGTASHCNKAIAIDSNDEELGKLSPVPMKGEPNRVRSHCQTPGYKSNQWTGMYHTRTADEPYGINTKIDPVGWRTVSTFECSQARAEVPFGVG